MELIHGLQLERKKERKMGCSPALNIPRKDSKSERERGRETKKSPIAWFISTSNRLASRRSMYVKTPLLNNGAQSLDGFHHTNGRRECLSEE